MSRTTKLLGLAILVLVIAAPSTPAWAAPGAVSEHFPNDGLGGGNVDSPCTGCGATAMDLRLQIAAGGPITTSVALAALQSGPTVADNAATALCTAAVAAGWACGGGCAFPSPLLSCTNGGLQIDFSQNIGSPSFSIVPGNVATKITGLHTKTSAGNTHGPDLLDCVLVRVNPNGHDGSVVFGVTGAPGPGPNPFTINTTGLNDQALHTALRNEYAALGVTATLQTVSQNSISIAPANFDGYFVALSYPPSVTEFEVNGQPGQILVEETSSPVSASVPALSEWGMAILIAILLLTGIWMMRRRQKAQPA